MVNADPREQYARRVAELEEIEADLYARRDRKGNPGSGHGRIMGTILREHRDWIFGISRDGTRRSLKLDRRARLGEARREGRLFVV